eukprot:CAMPEP_0206377274 /NCGR_PEP_ID=MMETSP0294-20121207/10056_1 /ASSEMBLY_ACC=CAM_ASM_000327 /TAXON_ID=39354 /ORGANISM="Heterosigma akashiwo, Strain CCMP2393" /LENGTH=53 /DNA_ID=CAMNT_0053825711 /DNA_START=510 /DNA_END=668 /DNA_ORIENTATION=+
MTGDPDYDTAVRSFLKGESQAEVLDTSQKTPGDEGDLEKTRSSRRIRSQLVDA